MDWMLFCKAVIMGMVEGLTEFLPISSTGHLIVTGSLINFTGHKIKTFEIAIQAAAIFAVLWEYRAKIGKIIGGLGHDPAARRFVLNVLLAFLPAALLGALLAGHIQAVLFAPVPVALAFIIGGFVILWAEWRQSQVRVETVEQMTSLDALKIGLAQVFALIPGTSRSGASIIGGMLFGLSRKAATEFSFFLAIPTIFGATVYSLYKERDSLSLADLPLFGVGFVAAFISAFFCVRWLLRYISTHDFTVFAWYRIGFGLLILLTDWLKLVRWAQ